jgi:multiple sugar transport system substrate-binding protein
MQQQCRRFGAGFLLALLAPLAGCSCNQTPPPALPKYAGVTIRVAAPTGRPRLLVDSFAKAWANAGGAKLVVTTAGDEWPAADLVLIPATDLPRWADAGKLAPLPHPGAVDAFMPLYRTRLLGWTGKPFALPVIGDAPVGVYRLDLYADPANQQAYQDRYHRPLQPPPTWEEFADQAEFFSARRARPSLPPLPADDDGVCAAFGAVAAPDVVKAVIPENEKSGGATVRSAKAFSFQYDIDSGEPRLTDAGFVAALALLKRMEPHRAIAGSVAEALRADQAALGYVRLADLGALGPEAKRWGVFRAPGHADKPGAPVNVVPYVGAGAVLGVVPANAAQPAAAFDLLAYLSGPSVSTEVAHTPAFGSGPFRDIHIDPQHEGGWLNYELGGQQTAALLAVLRDVADPRIDNPALALRIPGRQKHFAALAATVRAAVGGGDPAGELKAAAEKWRALDGELTNARAAYRWSVGLRP